MFATASYAELTVLLIALTAFVNTLDELPDDDDFEALDVEELDFDALAVAVVVVLLAPYVEFPALDVVVDAGTL